MSNPQDKPTGPARGDHPNEHRLLRAGVLLAGLSLAAVVVSCVNTGLTVMVPAQIPGATYVGSQACAQCHENITRDFKTATHARLMAKGTNAVNMGCESCHGPASLHVESAGERKPNYGPGRAHLLSGSQRQTIINPRRSSENCYGCHLDKRGQFGLPFHHPVPEGKVSCGDCHDPHKGTAAQGGGATIAAQNEVCFKCHTRQRGPFAFEHEALREGCTTCHSPHGSVNAVMLNARNQVLCLRCHFQQQTAPGRIVIHDVDHTAFLGRGTCWSGGCHEAVHGSQVSPSLRF
jgi:predicted CXXCH cytochrome family protein